MKTFFVVLALVALVSADMYMQNPRGANNRLDEQNRNRANANRVWDSQNNNKGGYNVVDQEFIAGSKVPVQWTNQHSCGAANANCQIVVQTMCEPGATGAGIRNGAVTKTIPTAMADDAQYGRHETGAYYAECTTRERNKGLFLADQNLGGNTAKYSRQNTNGQRSGLECPEERDYYPYWHPTPFEDVAIITTEVQRCAYYQAQSQNVVDKGHCTGTLTTGAVKDGRKYNNQGACEGNGFTWVQDSKFGTAAPDCVAAAYSRDNHLGNGVAATQNSYDWALPDVTDTTTCILRMRYNISTNDFDGWAIDANSNGNKSPVQQNPNVDVGGGVNLKLALNTDQYFRTFQDRSHVMRVVPRPEGLDEDATILNLGVTGQRGNIVQNYPAVEYDFSYAFGTITTKDYVQRYVVGSNTTPAGAGQGRESTDKSNFVQITNPGNNYPTPLKDVKQFGGIDIGTPEGFQMVKEMAMQGQNDNEIDDAEPNQRWEPENHPEPGSFHYMSSRTNNFSNRSQKAYLMVVEGSDPLPTAVIVAIVIVGAAVIAVPTAAGGYAAMKPNSRIGAGARNALSAITGGGGGAAPALPTGYAIN